MADLGIWTKSVDIVAKAGINANSTSASTAETDKYVLEVEAYVNCSTRKNWSAAVTAGPLDASVQGLLKLASSNICAILVINNDMSNFSSRTEAETMMDVLWDIAKKAIELLADQDVKDFIEEAP